MSLERLVFEHDAIDLISRNLLVLTRQAPPDFESAISLLALLAGEVESHLEYEDRTVYAVLIDRYQKPPFIGAERFEQLFEVLKTDWCDYLADWSEGKVRAGWSGFCAATAGIIPRLQARVRTENELIYSRALNDGVITLREAS